MSLRLFAVVVCGASALLADVCSNLPAAPSEPSIGGGYWGYSNESTPPPLSYRLTVKPGGPAFRITVSNLPLTGWQFKNEIVHAGDIEVASCRDGKQLQSLPIMAWQAIHFGTSLVAQDINFDGYLDFDVLTEFAGKFVSRSYRLYDPRSGLFVENELTRLLGENCLGTEWHGACWKSNGIYFDQKKREISTQYLVGLGLCSAPSSRNFPGDRYRVENNRLVLIHKEAVNFDSCVVTYSDLIGGTMRVTKVLQLDHH